jgi:hypothetical protein
MNEDLEKFLKSNPALLRNLKTSLLLGSGELVKRAENRIKRSFEEHLASQNPLFPDELPPDYIYGDIAIGKYTLNQDILIKCAIASLSGHIVNASATGGGKSNTTLVLLHQIQKKYSTSALRYMLFASKRGGEHRNLIINNPPGTAFFLDKNILALNPLSPIANTDHNLVLADFARTGATELGLMVGGQLYKQNRLCEYVAKNKDGNLIGFVNWLANKSESSLDLRGYKDRLTIRLQTILYELKSIFNCYTGIDDHIFVEHNLVIELLCSSSFIMSFVSGIILARMFRFKASNPEFMRYKNLIVLEDIQGGLRHD